MNLHVLVPGERWFNRAGVRIRYKRLAPFLEKLGWSLHIRNLGDLTSEEASPGDVYILSKCQDARGLSLVQDYRRQGCCIGLDLFDDYFSQSTSQCLNHRRWLRDMAPHIDFFLCSTRRMADVGMAAAANTPAHVLNDPFDDFDVDHLKSVLIEQRDRALRTRSFSVLWFGNGDNPIFPVGITDLTGFGSILRHFTQSDFRVDLKILTNRRAVSADKVRALKALPLPFQIEEWTEEREKDLLAESLVSFLPVNYQNFSIAKSLNRGVSALTGGAQILSAGFPLYQDLDSFVYDDPSRIIADLVDDRLALRPDTLGQLSEKLAVLADPENEARALAQFFRDRLRERKPVVRPHPDETTDQPISAILHGSHSPPGIHNFARSLGWLSLASPFSPAGRQFDAQIGFFEGDDNVQIWLGKRGYRAVTLEARRRIVKFAEPRGDFMAMIPISRSAQYQQLAGMSRPTGIGKLSYIAQYADVIRTVSETYRDIFGPVNFVHSEQDSSLMTMIGG